MDEVEGEVRFHHLLPEVRVLEARRCAARWIVFHETYDFCLAEALPDERVQWRYRHRLYSVDPEHVIMAMQPGELHANLEKTPPADFIVLQIAPALMLRVARELGWSRPGLNLSPLHVSSSDPALRRALLRVSRSLCRSSASSRAFSCRCTERPEVHAENLVQVVLVFIERCAEAARGRGHARRAPALVRRARNYLIENWQRPYDLDALAREAGCSEPFYLLHAFKEAFGVCPSEFRRRVLVAKTCTALASSPNLQLEAIARQVGWNGRIEDALTSKRLITHFRRGMGVTPNEFRRPLREIVLSEWARRSSVALAAALAARQHAVTERP